MWNLSEIQRLLIEFYGFFTGLLLGVGPYGEPLRAVYQIAAWLIVFLPAILIVWAVRDIIKSIRSQDPVPVHFIKRFMWFPILVMLIMPLPSRFVMRWIYSDPYFVYLNPHARQQLFFRAKLPLLNWIIYGLARSGLMLAGHIAQPWEHRILKQAARVCYAKPETIWAQSFNKLIGQKIEDEKLVQILQTLTPQEFQRYYDVFQGDLMDFCRLTTKRAILPEIFNGPKEIKAIGVIAFQNAYLLQNRFREDVLDGYAAIVATLLAQIDTNLLPASCQDSLPFVCAYTAIEKQKLREAKAEEYPYVIIGKAQKMGFWGRLKAWAVDKTFKAKYYAQKGAERVKEAFSNTGDSLKAILVGLGGIIGYRKGGLKMDSAFTYSISVAYMGFMLYFFIICLLTIIRTYFFLVWRIPFAEAHGEEFLRLAKQYVAIFFVPSFAILGFFVSIAVRAAVLEVLVPILGKVMGSQTFLSFIAEGISRLILSLTTVFIFAGIIFQIGTIPLKIASRMDEGVVGQEGPQLKPSMPFLEKHGVQ